MAISRIQSAKPALLDFFNKNTTKLFRPTDLAEILSINRSSWQLAKNTNTKQFIEFLMEQGDLKLHEFPFPYRNETRYVWGNLPLLEILMSLKTQSYFTHLTALELHQLTDQKHEDIYFNHEQKPQPPGIGLEQGRIDAAFKRKVRESTNIVEKDGMRIHLLNGKHTRQLGVIEMRALYGDEASLVRVTNIERTLIDAVVRPIYAGGVTTVQTAFQKAKGKVDIQHLSATLSKLGYLYPYHQSVGYYLEVAGYPSKDIERLKTIPMEFDFYLSHQIENPKYVKEWRLYVPQ
ncbi:hypothetical protein E2K99_02065 [Herbaspirillum huttiense]|uniref:type IV toxin-antitoxin system AbiEi family antitoxin domain-containing protein n=1 Tax=Herbaspirillum huttiense TaxID=863372 RepID=UPI001066A30A|nr:hypothetical protein [Herbaspirillum huttiense]QBP73869.1 hypothetical protein E2K99_02065 [Herbaspirillum huttiense]